MITINLLVVPDEEFDARPEILKKQAADEAFLNVDTSAEDGIAKLEAGGFIGPVRELERRQEVARIRAALAGIANECTDFEAGALVIRATRTLFLREVDGYISPYPSQDSWIATPLAEPMTPEAAEILLAFFRMTGFDDSSVQIWSGDEKLGFMALYAYEDESNKPHLYPIVQWGEKVEHYTLCKALLKEVSRTSVLTRANSLMCTAGHIAFQTIVGTLMSLSVFSVSGYWVARFYLSLPMLKTGVDFKGSYIASVNTYVVPFMEYFCVPIFWLMPVCGILLMSTLCVRLAYNNHWTSMLTAFFAKATLIVGTVFWTLFMTIVVVQGLA